MPAGSKPGERRGGRQKGTPNHLTTAVKEGIEQVIHDLGGYERLKAWVLEHEANERAFWTGIMPKLLPLQVNAQHKGDININVKTVQDLMREVEGKTRGL